MTQPMYGYEKPKWWDLQWTWRRRPWVVLVHTARWTWYDSVFRFNGGGYMYGADPYEEWTVGCVTVRKHVGSKQTLS